MTATLHRRDPRFGWMLLFSILIHLTCYLILVKYQLYSFQHAEGPVYYVDVVSLPVANPQAGSPSQPGGAPTPAKREEMALPARSPQQPIAKPKTPQREKSPSSAETSRQFEERLAKIEQQVGAKREAAAIEALRAKVAGRGGEAQLGVPGGKGTEAGSDYAGYIRSRLTDAFRTTIAFQTKSPEVMVRLTIDRSGKVAGIRLERSTGDRIFEDAVLNAIAKAEQTFVPPPGGKRFEYSYRFAPEGVSKK
ncbi:MAG TPA: TonB family protein [Geobacteraceae bacterium]|nr:TonB family protein [Geobacteraceae bacterium]